MAGAAVDEDTASAQSQTAEDSEWQRSFRAMLPNVNVSFRPQAPSQQASCGYAWGGPDASSSAPGLWPPQEGRGDEGAERGGPRRVQAAPGPQRAMATKVGRW